MKFFIEKTNGQFWTGSCWGVKQAAEAFERGDLISFSDGDKCDITSFFDNSIGGVVIVGWADDSGETIAQAVEVK